MGQWRDRGASSARSDPGPLLVQAGPSMHCSVVAKPGVGKDPITSRSVEQIAIAYLCCSGTVCEH